jgi:SPP1 gp7 family putative phage head morphogenesis protein
MQAVDFTGWAVLAGDVQPILEAIAKDGSAAALVQIGIDDTDVLDQANDAAVGWAKARSAELVGMRYDDEGNLITNPNAEWAIDEPTRDGIRSLVTQAEQEGWPNADLAKQLQGAYAFSKERASMIARTETAMADVNGNMAAYKASGQVAKKYWVTADDDAVSDDCQSNADAGKIHLDDDFPSGDVAPPAHPNCRCDIIPVLSEINEE